MCVCLCACECVCVRVCVHVCVRGIVCELCTCMCVMISLTWHHTNISNIILITVINKLKNKKKLHICGVFEAIYVACSIVRVNWC